MASPPVHIFIQMHGAFPHVQTSNCRWFKAAVKLYPALSFPVTETGMFDLILRYVWLFKHIYGKAIWLALFKRTVKCNLFLNTLLLNWRCERNFVVHFRKFDDWGCCRIFFFKSEAFCCLLITAGVTGLSDSKHPFRVNFSLLRQWATGEKVVFLLP